MSGTLTHPSIWRWKAIGLILAILLSMVPRNVLAERTILTIIRPDGEAVTFDDAALHALPWTEIATSTRWTVGVQIFRGPSLGETLRAAGLDPVDMPEKVLLLRALNDFAIEIPVSDILNFDPILARDINGEAMRIRDKGPLWVVYPRDHDPRLMVSKMDERWIWQLNEIVVP